jgi:hypothetical protein
MYTRWYLPLDRIWITIYYGLALITDPLPRLVTSFACTTRFGERSLLGFEVYQPRWSVNLVFRRFTTIGAALALCVEPFSWRQCPIFSKLLMISTWCKLTYFFVGTAWTILYWPTDLQKKKKIHYPTTSDANPTMFNGNTRDSW